ncbi:hypothetical protein ACFSQ3_08505 [Sphingobacterium corticis]|uniref:DUF541 domain-containing protein n=1 Tax=Sphingobacterium corticis TaxID=1812823 RepID=A0ABW5NIY0_9SPHI
MKEFLKVIFSAALLLFSDCLFAQHNRSQRIFVKNPDAIYLGAFVSKSSINESEHIILDAPTDSLTVSSSLPILSKRFACNKLSYEKAVADMIEAANLSNFGSVGFASTQREFVNYADLNVLFGQEIDIESFLMTKATAPSTKTNLVFNVEHIFADFAADIKKREFDAEKLNGLEEDNIAYVSVVEYGRKAVLLVESNLGEDIVKEAINDAFEKGGIRSSKFKDVLANCTIRYISLDASTSPEELDLDPVERFVNYLENPVTKEDFKSPMSFHLSTLNNGMYLNEYP